MESNELHLTNTTRDGVRDFINHNQDRQPRNNQRRLKLSCELNNAMQDRQWKSSNIRDDLESIRKFSILNCIRERVFDVLSELPLLSIECLCQHDIDGLIRRNLLRERKVRFNADNEYEGEEKIQKSEEEIEKENILEEMDIILKVLGNDKCNKLVIENFELLEQRIARVEQRLSGLVKRLPIGKVSTEIIQSQIKIDVDHVRTDIQNFVNKFNQVFTSDFELPTGTTDTSPSAKHSQSSTNRLKFHMLSRLPEKLPIEGEQDANNKDQNGEKNSQDTNGETNNQTDVNANISADKFDSKTNQHALKAVDSLITLRERFKAQSAKWLKMKGCRYLEEPILEETNTKIEEIFLSKCMRDDETQETTKTETSQSETIENTELKQIEPKKENLKKAGEEATIANIEPILQDTAKRLKEITNLVKHNKSVQTSLKKKKNRSKSKTNQKKQKTTIQQAIDANEVWVQYVNKKVLKLSKSSVDINDQSKPTKESPKSKKEAMKTEKNQKKSKSFKTTNSRANFKETEQAVQKNELKIEPSGQIGEGNSQVPTQFKEYKKIFLLKIPKTTSKQHFKAAPKMCELPPPKKIEPKALTVIKEPNQKNLPEKTSKTKSLIRLFPKAFKSKPKDKKIKEDKTQKLYAKPITPKDSLQKLSSNQFLNKIRSRWIYAADLNGELVQKPLHEWIVPTEPTQCNLAKHSKPPQKPKKKSPI